MDHNFRYDFWFVIVQVFILNAIRIFGCYILLLLVFPFSFLCFFFWHAVADNWVLITALYLLFFFCSLLNAFQCRISWWILKHIIICCSRFSRQQRVWTSTIIWFYNLAYGSAIFDNYTACIPFLYLYKLDIKTILLCH